MFGFLRRKKTPDPDTSATPAASPQAGEPDAAAAAPAAPAVSAAPAEASARSRWWQWGSPSPAPAVPGTDVPDAATPASPDPDAHVPQHAVPADAEGVRAQVDEAVAPEDTTAGSAAPAPAAPTPVVRPTAAPAPAAAPARTAVAAVEPPVPSRAGWMARLRQGLSRTRGGIAGLFGVGTKIDEALYEELETALLMSDAGYEATTRVLGLLRERVRERRVADAEGVRGALAELIAEQLMPLEAPIDIDAATPLVVMITGVNGAGKTTSIGKLARHLQREGKSILLAAGDTFRAAAREQLATWGERNDVQVIAQQGGDPAAVAFDAVSAGQARGTGVVMIDTAGRLPTQTHLMDELKKIRRVLGKAMAGAPHQVLLILDGNTGQNMLAQVKAFDESVGLTGLIVTKLDGTAKGGALLGLAWQCRDRPIPVYFIGVGEGIDDLQAFSAVEFADAMVGRE